jgi:hypothetical protein
MNSDRDATGQARGGLPHSETPGSPIARISPGFFAACHVLHRLSVPRHPPDALTSRLITGLSHDERPHHRRAQGQTPRFRGGRLPFPAVSHEDTSRTHPQQALLAPPRQAKLCFAKRAGPALLAHGPVRLGHIINALFTLQSTAAAVSAAPAFCFSERRPGPLRHGWCCRPATPGFAGGGGERIRTDDLLLAKQALSQLSYTPASRKR